MKMPSAKNQCPSDTTCDGEVHRERINYTFESEGRKVTLPDLEVWQCNQCNAIFFPAEANERIDLYERFSGELSVRIPPDLHFQLTKTAEEHHRSLDQEITFLLSQEFRNMV